MTKFHIYCDMDGVLVDFNKGYFELTGHKLDGIYRTDTNFWDPINQAGYDFWINLDWMPDGKELWSYIKKYKPELLSAPSRHPSSKGRGCFCCVRFFRIGSSFMRSVMCHTCMRVRRWLWPQVNCNGRTGC